MEPSMVLTLAHCSVLGARASDAGRQAQRTAERDPHAEALIPGVAADSARRMTLPVGLRGMARSTRNSRGTL